MPDEARFEFVLIDKTTGKAPAGTVPPAPVPPPPPPIVERLSGDQYTDLAQRRQATTQPPRPTPAPVQQPPRPVEPPQPARTERMQVKPGVDIGPIKMDPKTGLPKLTDEQLAKLTGQEPPQQAPEPGKTRPPTPPFIPKPPPLPKPPEPEETPLERIQRLTAGALVGRAGAVAAGAGGRVGGFAGGALAGGAVQGGLAGAAARLAPVAVPVAGAAAAVAVPIVAARAGVGAAERLGEDLKTISADVATAVARREVTQLQTRLRTAEELGPQIAATMDQVTNIQKNIAEIRNDWLPILLTHTENLLKLADIGVKALVIISDKTVPIIKWIQKLGPFFDPLQNPIWDEVGKWLGEQLNENATDKALSIFDAFEKLQHLTPPDWENAPIRRGGFAIGPIPGMDAPNEIGQA